MPHRLYLDGSALAKRYVLETGTPVINYLFQRVPRDRLVCLKLGTLEVISVLVRRRNASLLSSVEFQQAMADLRSEVLDATDFTKVSPADVTLDAAMPFLERHSLNATDAVVLASALDLAAHLRAVGDDLILVASDQRLLRAAQAEGLVTFDPETQDQADLDALLVP